MILSQGGNLRKVRNGYNLPPLAAHFLHDNGHLLRYLARHTGVNLIKYDGGQLHYATYHSLEREHHTCYLASGSNLRDGLHLGAFIGTKVELYLVAAVFAQRFGLYASLKTHVGHTQWYESLLHFRCQQLAGLAPHVTQFSCFSLAVALRLGQLLLQQGHLFIAVGNGVEFVFQVITQLNELSDRRYMELLLQRIDLVQLIIHLV